MIRVIAGAFAVALGVTTFDTEQISVSAILIAFLVVLPLLNALADLLSLAATRWFFGYVAPEGAGDQTPRRASLLLILSQLGFDLVAAVACLLLLGTIVGALELWGQVSPATLPLDWRNYLAEMRLRPAAGLALYLMLMTTLVPTAVHAAAGLGAVFTHRSRLLRRVADQLETAQESGQFPS